MADRDGREGAVERKKGEGRSGEKEGGGREQWSERGRSDEAGDLEEGRRKLGRDGG